MKNLILLLIAASQISAQLLGGFNQSDVCLNIDGLGLPIKLVGLQSEGIYNFFGDQTNKNLELVHLATQVVAGLNYRAIFKFVDNGRTFWVGVIAFRSLQGAISITKFLQTNDVNDIFTLFKMTGFTEANLKPVPCGCLFEGFLSQAVLTEPEVDPVPEQENDKIIPIDGKDHYIKFIIPAPVEEEKQPHKTDHKHEAKDEYLEWNWENDKERKDFDWSDHHGSRSDKKSTNRHHTKHAHGQHRHGDHYRGKALLVGSTANDDWSYENFENTQQNKH